MFVKKKMKYIITYHTELKEQQMTQFLFLRPKVSVNIIPLFLKLCSLPFVKQKLYSKRAKKKQCSTCLMFIEMSEGIFCDEIEGRSETLLYKYN